MATLFVEYKDSEPEGLNGRAVLVKEEVISVLNIQSRLGNSFRITVISSRRSASARCCCVRAP